MPELETFKLETARRSWEQKNDIKKDSQKQSSTAASLTDKHNRQNL